MNTNKKRRLQDSKYNERRTECDKALEIIKTQMNVNNLCQLKSMALPQIKKIIGDNNIYKRVLHVVSENIRVTNAVKALEENDLAAFGKLMIRSHESLCQNYEVTGDELDSMVASVLSCNGVLGARMTGAGFGGCAIALIYKDKADSIIQRTAEMYHEHTQLIGDYIIAESSDGLKVVWERN